MIRWTLVDADALQSIPEVVKSINAESKLYGSVQPQKPKLPPLQKAVSGRNATCPCGSGRKYKKCHFSKALPTEEKGESQ